MTETSSRIVTWNTNGLALRSRELETFLVYNNIDIALISETHFTKKKLPKDAWIYSVSYYLSDKAHAGSAIIIKNNVKYHLQDEIWKEYIQVTAIMIQYNNVDLILAAAYCPCHNIKNEQFSEVLNSLGPRFILEGDFNAKHMA